jgi:hypothetical protein
MEKVVFRVSVLSIVDIYEGVYEEAKSAVATIKEATIKNCFMCVWNVKKSLV